MRKSKALVALSVVIAATVFGVLIFSVSASDDVASEEPEHFFQRFHSCWEQTLTEDQLETLKAIINENHAEIQDQIDAWGVEFSELDEEQHEILREMIEANHDEVEAQLEAWGIEIPVCPGPMGLLDSLTDEQKEELQTMYQNFRESVNAKLEEWGINLPEIDGTCPCDMGFHGRAARGFGPFRP